MGNYIGFKNYTKNFKLFHKFYNKPIFISVKTYVTLGMVFLHETSHQSDLWYFIILDKVSAEFCENTFS